MFLHPTKLQDNSKERIELEGELFNVHVTDNQYNYTKIQQGIENNAD